MCKNIRVSFLVLIFVGCSYSRDNSAPAPFDQAKLDALSASTCTGGQKLKEDLVLIKKPLHEFVTEAKVIGFYSGDGQCIRETDIKDAWPDSPNNKHFTLIINSTCLMNNSFWRVVEFGNDSSHSRMTLESTEGANIKPMTVDGSGSLPATYARDHAGLRVLTCQ